MSGSLNTYRFDLPNTPFVPPAALPPAAGVGLGSAAQSANGSYIPLAQQPVLSDGKLSFPQFGQYSVPTPTGGTGGTGATGGTGGTGATGGTGGTASGYTKTQALAALNSALRQAGISSPGRTQATAAFNALFTGSVTTVTQSQLLAALAPVWASNSQKLSAVTKAFNSALTGTASGGTGATGGTGGTAGASAKTSLAAPASTSEAGQSVSGLNAKVGALGATGGADTAAAGATGATGGTSLGPAGGGSTALLPSARLAAQFGGAQGGDGGGAGDTSTSSYGGSYAGPAPGLMGLASMAYNGQAPSVGYGLASLGTMATGPAGMAVGALGQGLSALGFSPSTNPHGIADAGKGLGTGAELGKGDGSEAGADKGDAQGTNTDATDVGTNMTSSVEDGYGGTDQGEASVGSADGPSGGSEKGDGSESGAGGADTGGQNGSETSSSASADGYANGGLVQNNRLGGVWATDSYMTPNRQPVRPAMNDQRPMDANGGAMPRGYASGGPVDNRWQFPRPQAGTWQGDNYTPAIEKGAMKTPPNFAGGGAVDQSMLAPPNPPGPDDGMAALDGGEYVIRAAMVPRYGAILEQINAGTYQPEGEENEMSYAQGAPVGGQMFEQEGDEMMEPGGGDYGSSMEPSPLAPQMAEDGLTVSDAMQSLAMMAPDQKMALSMALADPNLAGALLSLLGPAFSPVLSQLMSSGQTGGMGGGMGADPMMGHNGGPPMGGGAPPPSPQGAEMGGYAAGGMVRPAAPMHAQPPGAPPPHMMGRQPSPVPMQRPRPPGGGLASVMR